MNQYDQITIPAGKGIPLYFKGCGKVSSTLSLKTKSDGTNLKLIQYNDGKCDDSYITQTLTCQDSSVYDDEENQYLIGEGQKARVTCGTTLFSIFLVMIVMMMF